MANASVRSTSSVKSSDVPVVRSMLTMVELATSASLPNMLRADLSSIIPKKGETGNTRMETKQYAPIISINDLAKNDQKGDTIRLDIHHRLRNLPTMCCDPLEGREEERTYSTFEMKIGLTRHGVKDRCVTMNTQRLGNDAFNMARPELVAYMDDLKTERIIYQLAGARGHHYVPGAQILLLDGMDFRKTMINCLEAPTYCRHYYGGDATDFDGQCGDGLDEDDIFDLNTLTNISASLEESAYPLPPIKLSENGMDIKYMIMVTPSQWRDFRTSSDGKWYAELQAMARQAKADCGGHPAFSGDCLFWDGILVKKYKFPVRFKPGYSTLISNDDDCASVHEARLPASAKFAVDRAIILGGAALAEAWGGVKDAEGTSVGFQNYAYWSGTYDGGEGRRVHIKALDGEKKIRFASKLGRVYDHGVAVLDTAIKYEAGKSC